MTHIQVSDITKIYLRKSKVFHKALIGITFDIQEGEAVGILGRNGAGKSTLLKIICGILLPTTGKVDVCGISPEKERIQNAYNIGAVFGHKTQLWWDLPLVESFEMLKKIYSIDQNKFRKRLELFCDEYKLRHLLPREVCTMSLGERVKSDIFAALLHDPKILVLDEPFFGLDICEKESVLGLLKTINREHKTTVLFATHDIQDISALCGVSLILDRGKLLYHGDAISAEEEYKNNLAKEEKK